MKHTIFISYSRKDIKLANQLKSEIEHRFNVKCWMDLDGIENGAQFEDGIISAIDNSECVLFLLSENSMESEWTKREVRYAYETQKTVIPINIDGCQPKGWFLFRLSGTDIVSYDDDLQRDSFYNKLGAMFSYSDSDSGNGTGVVKEDVNSLKQYRFFKICIIVQFAIFGIILYLLTTMFIYGFLASRKETLAFTYHILLCLCLCGSLFLTFYLSKLHKLSFWLICLMDFIEILLVCALAQRIYAHGPHFYLLTYKYLSGLGYEIKRIGFLRSTVLMDIFAVIHVVAMTIVIMLKVKGKRLWDYMK